MNSQRIAVSGLRPAVLGIDVGGTSIKAAIIDAAGTIMASVREPTGAAGGPHAALQTVLATATALAGRAAHAGAALTGAGIVVPGIVDETTGTALWSANLGWRDLAIGDLLAAQLNLPVVVGHDVRAGAIAEAHLGAGKGVNGSVLFVAVGTGIAAAHVIGGHIYPGAQHAAGEIGHLKIDPNGPPCSCSQRGCLEAVASAAALARRYHLRTGNMATAQEIVGYASQGDPDAAAVWRDAVDSLADGLAMTITITDPAQVIIGGGLSQAGTTLLKPLRAALHTRLPVHSPPDLAVAALGDLAGCHGAALLATRPAATRPGQNGASGHTAGPIGQSIKPAGPNPQP